MNILSLPTHKTGTADLATPEMLMPELMASKMKSKMKSKTKPMKAQNDARWETSLMDAEKLEATFSESADYALVAQAIHYLGQNFQEQPSLDALSELLHISPFHLQRVFSRWAGI